MGENGKAQDINVPHAINGNNGQKEGEKGDNNTNYNAANSNCLLSNKTHFILGTNLLHAVKELQRTFWR